MTCSPSSHPLKRMSLVPYLATTSTLSNEEPSALRVAGAVGTMSYAELDEKNAAVRGFMP